MADAAADVLPPLNTTKQVIQKELTVELCPCGMWALTKFSPIFSSLFWNKRWKIYHTYLLKSYLISFRLYMIQSWINCRRAWRYVIGLVIEGTWCWRCPGNVLNFLLLCLFDYFSLLIEPIFLFFISVY